MNRSIILIGPSKAGKTVLSHLLAQALGWKAIDLDDLRWDYFAEMGYDKEQAAEIRQRDGFKALVEHWKPFDIHGVERVLADYPERHVIAFGAGHSVYEDEAQFERAQMALAPFPHVIYLRPAPDIEMSIRHLAQRLRQAEPDSSDEFVELIMSFNRYFMEHPSNARLATLTVYSDGKTPTETAGEIVRRGGLKE